MTWLVTGGAGYIGSHICLALRNRGLEVIAVDNFANSDGSRLDGICNLVQGDFRDTQIIEKIARENQIQGVMHIAGLKSPEESIKHPEIYDEVNNIGTRNFIEQIIDLSIPIFIQSSSSSVYGETNLEFISENSPLIPLSPYGLSKLNAEVALNHFINLKKIRGASLRFFNVVGTMKNELKDNSKINLFPSIKEAIINRSKFYINGSDYKTLDGTSIRDYIHVEDIAEAHIEVALKLARVQIPNAINLGTGEGYSILEVISNFEKATNLKLDYDFTSRRPGDPARVVADVRLMRNVLNFTTRNNLEKMVLDSL